MNTMEIMNGIAFIIFLSYSVFWIGYIIIAILKNDWHRKK